MCVWACLCVSNGIDTIILSLIVSIFFFKNVLEQNNFITFYFLSFFFFCDESRCLLPKYFLPQNILLLKNYGIIKNNLAPFHIQLKF